jgi:hypothetical protein
MRVQVILDEKDALRFRFQAKKESKSLSAWLREAGRQMIEKNGRSQSLSDPAALKVFFKRCHEREMGQESDWEEHKKSILKGYQNRGRF